MSELKCCKRCGAFLTCTTKGECCPECEYFDPVDNVCMAIPKRKKEKQDSFDSEPAEIDPDTYLFEDDDEEEDLSDLPPEREEEDGDVEDDEDDFDFDEDDDW